MTAPAISRVPAPRTREEGEDRLRVLHVGKFYAPYRGGMETHLEQLCQAQRTAADVEVVVSASSREGRRETVDGVPVTRLGTVATVASAPISPGLRVLLRASSADVVHVHLPHPTAVLAYLASGRRGALVATYHSDIVRQRVLGRAFEPVLRRFLDRCDAVIVSSPDYLESSPTLRAFRDRCRVIPFGIPLAPFDAADAGEAAAIRARYGPRLVLAVGRQVGYKGFGVLVRAMADVDGRLLLVGDGPLRAELEAEARACEAAERVTFLGQVPDVRPYYRAADVFALPSVSRAEAFGIVQLEAMASGTPVVNTALDSGVPFVSPDGKTGLTVAPNDAPALAAALTRLLDDPALRARYGAAGRRRVEAEFSVDVMTRRTLALYRAAVRAHVGAAA